MQASLRLRVGCACFFGSLMKAAVDFLPVHANTRRPHPAGGMPSHAGNPAPVVRGRAVTVLEIFGVGGLSQIGESVVLPDAVYVVDLVCRPATMNKQPNQPMRPISTPIYPNLDVVAGAIAGVCSGWNHAMSTSCAGAGEPASRLIVVEQFAQTRDGNIGSSHEAVFSLSGQRPGSVASTCSASLF